MGTITLTNLTPATAQQNLQNDGLDALGLTIVALSARWSFTDPVPGDFLPNQATLTVAANLRAPFRGLLGGVYAPVASTLSQDLPGNSFTIQVTDATGFPTPLNGASVLFTLSNANGSKREVVACTARTGNNLTVTRAYNGGTPLAFSTGDAIRILLNRSNSSVQFTQANGQPLLQHCIVLRFHPQALLRLERLMAARLALPGSLGIRPVPACMLIHGTQHDETDQFIEADADMPVDGVVSFHDSRGLIVDPVYVAAVFDELVTWLPALQPPAAMGTAIGNGGVRKFAALDLNTRVHFVDMHGRNYQPREFTLQVTDGSGNVVAPIPAAGWLDLQPGQDIRSISDEGRLRFGWATNGPMSDQPLVPPNRPPGVNLSREFFRVCIVDMKWALLGNRETGQHLGIKGDDGRIPEELLPQVRDKVVIDYLADGPDTLAEATRILNAVPNTAVTIAVSPELDTTLATPATLGPLAHWPGFPAWPAPPMGAPAMPVSLAGAVTASFVPGTTNVVVTITGVVPWRAHVRVFPQQFVHIDAIGEEPSFVRGDGGANIETGGTFTVSVLLPNPFGVPNVASLPNPPNLTLDIVITPRIGTSRTFGAVAVPVTNNPPPAVLTPFALPAGSIFAAPPILQGVAPSGLFGIPGPPPTPPTATGNAVTDLLLSFITDSPQRQAPRMPTMARLETTIVSGATNPADTSYLWDAVVTGARWSPESRSAQHVDGNPGNPAGPDVHAPGVRVSGRLAYDVALTALRRAMPIIPMWANTQVNPGWVAFSAGNNFDLPDDTNPMDTGVGVLLRTVAAGCETSLLEGKTPPEEGLLTKEIIEDAIEKMGFGTYDIDLVIENEPRMQKEVRREFFIATHGLRDTQWSLLRAFSDARELIYIESPQFACTAQTGSPLQNYEVELVSTIAARLTSTPNLKVIVCTPRLGDFVPKFRSWNRQHYAARNKAVKMLMDVAPERVAVFHPVGFPGRSASIRTTSVIVDDAWSLVGATHFRRRGMTFDGSVAIASFDRDLEDGYSKKVRAFRRELMAAKLGVPNPLGGLPSGDWVRLARPESTFALVTDLLNQGGLGRIKPFWPGPLDQLVQAADDDIADPDGSSTANYLNMTTVAGVLNEIGD